MAQTWPDSWKEPHPAWSFLARHWRQSDWFSSLTWIGLGLLAFVHLVCFAAVGFTRAYYGESFNPVVFGQFVEAKRNSFWQNPLTPAQGVEATAGSSTTVPPTPGTILSAKSETKTPDVLPSSAIEPGSADYLALSETERQLVRERQIQLAQNSMREAERKWLLGQRQAALEMLNDSLNDLPDYVPLVKLLADFYEESGDASKARFFWEKVKLLSEENSTDAQSAQSHLAGLAQAEKAAAAGPVGAGKLRIVRVDQKLLPLEDLYDLRIEVQVTLASNLTEGQVEASQTHVEILFFDQYDTTAGNPLAVRTISTNIRPQDSWSSRRNESLSVTYKVPRGYWRNRLRTYGKSYDFCGYVVRVYYRGEFQDAYSSKELLLPWKTPTS